MKKKYAIAVMKGEDETILGIFNTLDEADYYGTHNRVPHTAGLQYCFSAPFTNGLPVGNCRSIYNYYNV